MLAQGGRIVKDLGFVTRGLDAGAAYIQFHARLHGIRKPASTGIHVDALRKIRSAYAIALTFLRDCPKDHTGFV